MKSCCVLHRKFCLAECPCKLVYDFIFVPMDSSWCGFSGSVTLLMLICSGDLIGNRRPMNISEIWGAIFSKKSNLPKTNWWPFFISLTPHFGEGGRIHCLPLPPKNGEKAAPIVPECTLAIYRSIQPPNDKRHYNGSCFALNQHL